MSNATPNPIPYARSRDGTFAVVSATVISVVAVVSLAAGLWLAATALRQVNGTMVLPIRFLAGSVLLVLALLEGLFAAIAWISVCRRTRRLRT